MRLFARWCTLTEKTFIDLVMRIDRCLGQWMTICRTVCAVRVFTIQTTDFPVLAFAKLSFWLMFVTFIVLLLVPAVYLIIEDIRNLRPTSEDTHDPQLVANPATK